MQTIKLVALDLDGTLFDNSSRIRPRCLAAIKRLAAQGVHVVISTGRPYSGIPFSQLEGTGVGYAITANGSAIYEYATGKCLYENAMEEALVLPILRYLLSCDIHIDAFIGGKAYSPASCLAAAEKLTVPPSIKDYILTTRARLSDMPEFITKNRLKVQKMTLNFFPAADGTLTDREKVRAFLEANPNISTVCGGYHNLEFTRADASKGAGLTRLAELLSIDIRDTMAIGDTENDLSIIETAGVGVAMGNATAAVKEHADFVTASNEEDGVADAIDRFCR